MQCAKAVLSAFDFAVLSVQAEWVLEHFDRPFPLPEEKDMLSRLTGLPRAQVLVVAVLGGNTCLCTAGAS